MSGGGDGHAPQRPPRTDRRAAFAALYRSIDREILFKQGRIHLRERADAVAGRAYRLMMMLVMTGLIGGAVIYLGFAAWLLWIACQIGADFSSLHRSAFAHLLIHD